MPKQYDRHLSNARAHLECATEALEKGEPSEEILVCIRCFYAEIDHAKRRGLASAREAALLENLRQQALRAESLLAFRDAPKE